MVSAVLVLAIFTAAFGVWTVDTIPDWVSAREHTHASEVALQFAEMRGTLDTISPGSGDITLTIDLAPDPIPLLQRAPAFGNLEMESGMTIDINMQPHVLVASGGIMARGPVAGAGSTWGQVANILAMDLQAAGTETTTIVASERLGSRSVTMSLANDGAGTCTITTETVAQTMSCGNPARINALADTYRFRGLVRQLDPDMTVAVTTGGLASIAYVDTEGNTRFSGDTSAAGTDHQQALSIDSAIFVPDYLEIEDRTVRFDGGGVVNVQRNVAAFMVEPAFRIDVDGGEGFVRWTIVDASGTGTLSGSDAGVLTFRKAASKDLLLHIPADPSGSDSLFTVSSTASAAWEDMWSDKLALGAISQASASNTGGASLALEPDIPWTIHLTIHDVELSVT